MGEREEEEQMRRVQRWSAFTVVLAMVLPMSAVAWAGEMARHAEREQVAINGEAPPAVTPDRDYGNIDAERDRLRDQDRTGVTDRVGTPTEVEPERDRVRTRSEVRCVDAVTDRPGCCPDRPVDFRVPEWCRDHEPPEINIRQLVWRLIHAGEWEMLFRLLHRLHII
jgi:hypothetical protein